MKVKKIVGKTKLAIKVLMDEGALSFSIKSLQKLQSKRSNVKTQRSQHGIHVKVKYDDVITANPASIKHWSGTSKKRLKFNWLMPPPGKGSGGHMNIFRFIKFLEDAGHTCRIYLYAEGGSGKTDHIWTVMGDSYPKVKATMSWLEDDGKMDEADGIFATSWETAYPALNSKIDAKRFYFVQDFEPYFYPIGTLYALAENTYRFGFQGITAGGWLANKLKRDYSMQTDFFDFGSDTNLYSYKNASERKAVFFYARPYTERRGFEMGIIALGLFHTMHPEYEINLAGWDVSDYDIPFPYNNLKTLELEELNGLYNSCAAGLVMSMTNMSLLPLELLGAGAIPVVNEGDNNRMVSSNPFIAYCPNDPVSLANKLSDVVSMKDLPTYAKRASNSVKTNTWQESGDKFIGIIEKAMRNE